MPNSYNVNIAVNEMGLDEKDKDLIEFSVSYVRAMEASGHIVWKDLGACMDLLGATYSGELDRYIPDLGPKRNWTAADSVLHLFNDNKKETRHRSWAHEQWQDNQFVWGRYVTDSKWAINDGGHIMDIVKALQEILEADDEVRGDPGKFQDHLSFLSMMNEKKHGLGPTFTYANEYLARFPVGTVMLMGPATSDMWWPDTKGSAANQKWQKLSGEYFALLTKGNIHP